jgi:hypothetical protein
MKPVVVGAAAVLLLAACGSDADQRAPIETPASRAAAARGGGAEAAQRDCFDVGAVNGFVVIDADTVRVELSPARAYEIDVQRSACANLRWTNAIALQSEPASSFLCVNDGAYAATLHTDQGERCVVDAIRRAPAPPAAGAGDAAE